MLNDLPGAFEDLGVQVSCYMQDRCKSFIDCDFQGAEACKKQNIYCMCYVSSDMVPASWTPIIDAYLKRRAACVSITST